MSESFRLWPTRFPPYHEESFSSWITRLACHYGTNPSTLVSLATNHDVAECYDWDRFNDGEAIAALALRTGLSQMRLRAATLSRFAGGLYGSLRRGGKLPLVRGRTVGGQICPVCLRVSTNPYHRLHWRLEFVAMCSDHHLVLVDRCHECGSRLHFRRPFRWSDVASRQERTGLCLCSICGADLRGAKPPSLPYGAFHDAEIVQRELLKVLRVGPQFGRPYDRYELSDFFREIRLKFQGLAEDFLRAQGRILPIQVRALTRLSTVERALLLAQLPRALKGTVSIQLQRSRYSNRTIIRLWDDAVLPSASGGRICRRPHKFTAM